MPALLLAEAGYHVIAKDPRNAARCCPLPAFLLSGQQVCNT